jgi:cobalamin biosynthesis protein CobD/CbiB
LTPQALRITLPSERKRAWCGWMSDTPKEQPRARGKAARLAGALKVNLTRRKAQARQRAEQPSSAAGSEKPPTQGR